MGNLAAPFIVSRAYISGPLHSAKEPEGARALYERIAGICRDSGIEPIVPHLMNDAASNPNLEPFDVFENDTSMLLGSDVVVAHVGAPSSGVGAEVAIALGVGIPVIAVWRPSESVSWYLLGLLRAAGAAEVTSEDLELHSELPNVLRKSLTIGRIRPNHLPAAKHLASGGFLG